MFLEYRNRGNLDGRFGDGKGRYFNDGAGEDRSCGLGRAMFSIGFFAVGLPGPTRGVVASERIKCAREGEAPSAASCLLGALGFLGVNNQCRQGSSH